MEKHILMGFELLFEKGQQVFETMVGPYTYTITLLLSDKIDAEYNYQLLLYRSSMEQSVFDLVQYTNENNFQLLQRDGILIDTSDNKVRVYELEIEIKNEELRKVGTLQLSICNPENIDTYQTKFISNFEEFDNKEGG